MKPRLSAWLAALVTCAAMCGVRPARAATQLLDMVLATQPDGAVLTLTLSARVAQHVFTLSQPDRIVIDLPQTRRRASLQLPASAGVVAQMRSGRPTNHDLRLVLELNSPLRPRVSSQIANGAYRLCVALGAAKPPAVAAAATTLATDAAPVPIAAVPMLPPQVVRAAHAPSTAERDIIIAIDAGHGGEDPGATGAHGTHEKDVVLAIARALAARVNRAQGMRAVLTRDGDYFIPLRERSARARAAHADMFVSIHADAVRDRAVSGASVYILSERGASNEAARLLAENENAADLKGVSLANQGELKSVLLDLSQSANIGASVDAADSVLGALDGVGAVRKREVQQAGFVVLKSPDIPSMLVETAYISNPAEERKLCAAPQQQRLAEAIFRGVRDYFRKYPPEGTQFARARDTGADRAVNVASN